MVAIFSGAGVGLERGSGSVLGARGLLGGSSLGQNGEQLFYNAFNGNLVVSRNDEFLVGRGPDVAITRTYNSKGDLSDDNGDNWRQSTDRRIQGLTGTANAVGSTVKRVSGDGSNITYAWDDTDDLYIATDGGGAYDTLVYDAGADAWTWTDGDSRNAERYEAGATGSWRITQQYDRDGNTVTFTYDSGGRLDKATTADGGYTQYVWDTANNRITSVVTGYTEVTTLLVKTVTRTSYGYDTAGKLATVTVDLTPGSTTDEVFYTTDYTYTSGRLNSIEQTDGSFLDIDYDSSGRVIQFTQTSAGTATRVTDIWYGTGYTRITDPTGHITRLYYDANGTLTRIQTDPASATATSRNVYFAYNADGDVTTVTDEAGKTLTFADFTDRGLAETETDRLATVIRRTWGANNQLLTDTRIGSDAGDDYAYHTTRYIYDSENHLRFTLSPEGRVVEYRYNGVGQQVSKIEYAATCALATELAMDETLSEAELDEWVTLQADRSTAQRTDSFYDHRGNVSRAVTYGVLSKYGEGAGGPLAITPGANTLVTQQPDGFYRVEKAAGADLTYNADAHSALRADGDFILQVKPNQLGKAVVAGLAVSPAGNAANNSMAFAFHFSSNGGLYYRENATSVHLGESYTVGMSYWIVRTGSTVNYYKGATLQEAITAGAFRTVADVSGSYYFDSSLQALDSSVDVKFTPQPIAPDPDGADVPTTTVIQLSDGLQRINKVGGTNGVWDAAASSTIAATGDFVLRLRPPRKDRSVAAGVSAGPDTSLTRDEIRYGLYFHSNGTLYYMHYGDATSFGYGYNAGDNYWIVRSGTTVSYYKGPTLAEALATVPLRTVTGSTGTLYFDSSFYTSNAAVDVDFAPAESATIELTRTYFAYDQAGRLLSRYSEGQNPESFVYDGMGRLTASTDLNRGTTDISFVHGTTSQTVVELANGLTRTSTYNKAGEVTTVVEVGEQVPTATATPFLYDKNGRLRVATDATGNTRYFLYDRAGRKFADVEENGAIVRYQYDIRDRIVATVRYGNKLTGSQLTEISSPNNDVADLVMPNPTDWDVWSWSIYDDEGRLVESIAGDGGVTTYAYDRSNQLVKTVAYANRLDVEDVEDFKTNPPATSVLPEPDPDLDRVTRTFYDKDGNTIGLLDAEGFLHRSIYDWQGRKTSDLTYADPTQASLRAAGTFNQLKSSVADQLNFRISRYVYDSRGRVRFEMNKLNEIVEHVYDRAGRRTVTTHYGGTISTSDYSLTNIVALIASGGLAADPDTRTSWTVYDAAGRVAYAIDGEDRVTGFTYDNMGQVTSTVLFAAERTTLSLPTLATMVGWGSGQASNAANQVTRTFYSDRPGEVRFVVDAEGYATEFEYDAEGRKVIETRWDDPISVATGTPTGEVDGDAQGTSTVTKYEYDLAGRLKIRRDAFGTSLEAVTQYGYDYVGNLVLVTDPRGNATWTYFDAAGRQIAVRDAEGHVTETEYDAFGAVASVTRRYNKATDTPAVGILPTVDPDTTRDAVTRFAYDQNGRLVGTTDAEDFVETYVLNAFGDRTSLVNKLNGTVTYTYDLAGRRLTEILPMSSIDSAGAIDATSVTNKFEYDVFGNLIEKTEALGLDEERVTIYRYDKANRLVETEHGAVDTLQLADLWTPATAPRVETIRYDAFDNVIETKDATLARSIFYYDRIGRKVAQLDALGTYTIFDHDRDGNVTTSTVFGLQVALPADAAAPRPAEPTTGGSRVTSYEYDALNRLTRTSIANLRTGVLTGTGYVTSVGTVDSEYAYDANGNLTKSIDGNNNILWSWYDKNNRKTAELDQDGYLTKWTLDREGNVETERRWATPFTGTPTLAAPPSPATDDAKDRVTSFTYDLNGRRIEETRSAVTAWVVGSGGVLAAATTPAKILYEYNGFGQVTKKTEATNEAVTYTYDKTGRLTKEERASYTDQAGATVVPTVRYAYDGLSNLTRTRQGGATEVTGDRITRYNYGAGGRLKEMIDAANATFTYFHDAAGNRLRESYTRHKADNSSTTDSLLYVRDALGRVTSQRLATRTGASWTNGDRQDIEYNAYGEVSRRGLNGVWNEQLDYDAAGRLWRTNGGDGVWRYFLYDAAGRRTLAIEAAGGTVDVADEDIVTVLNIATANGSHAVGAAYVSGINVTIDVLSKRGDATETWQMKRQLGPGGSQDLATKRTFTAFGEVASETDARNKTTWFAYNTMGRLVEKKSPAVSWTSEAGAVASDTPTETFYYDVSGRLVGTRDANQTKAANGDPDAGLISTRLLLAGTGYGGTEAQVRVEYRTDGTKWRTWYDVFGDARKLRNGLGISTSATADEPANDELRHYDAMGRVTKIEHRGRLLTDEYVYDELGQRIEHTNNEITATAEITDYDMQGRITRSVAFGGDQTSTVFQWNGGLVNSGISDVAIGGWVETTTFTNGRTLIEKSDVFGRLLEKTDLGSHLFTYTYDNAGRLKSQATSGETLTYGWYNTGLASSVTRDADNSASYTYDALGRKLTEVTTKSGIVVQNATAAYDDIGRMIAFDEAGGAVTPVSSIDWQYDLSGNIRRTTATYRKLNATGGDSGVGGTDDHWFRYDAMNRVVVEKGILSGGQIVRGTGKGVSYEYDAVGNRKKAFRTREEVIDINGGDPPAIWHTFQFETIEEYKYRGDGALTEVWISQDEYDGAFVAGTSIRRAVHEHDGMGRLTTQREYWYGTNVAWERTASYNEKSQVQTETVIRKLWNENTQGYDSYKDVSTHTYGSGTSYALGSVVNITTDAFKNCNDGDALDTSTDNTFAWWDGAVQSGISHDKDTGSSSNTLWTTAFTYGTSGQLQSVRVVDGRPRTIFYTTDMTGQVLRRDEDADNGTQDPHEVWYRFNGRQVGYTGNNGTEKTDYATSIEKRSLPPVNDGAFRYGSVQDEAHADFDQSLDPITSWSQGSAGGSYTVREGDTLAGIAAQLWGDASLWYKIAEANGMSGAASLVQGQILTMPVNVLKSGHNAATFTPYDPLEALGQTSPTNPKPNKSNRCGAFGAVLLTVVSLAVSLALPVVAPGIFAACGLLGSVGGAVAASMIGSAVSQGVGLATGIQDQFSWKSVAIAGLSAAVGGGLGKALGPSGIGGSKLLTDVVRGAAGSAISQGISVATGLQSKFDWAGVAAAGLGAAIGGAVSRGLLRKLDAFGDPIGDANTWNTPEGFGHNAAVSAADAIGQAAARSVVEGTSFGDNLIAALPSAIANTIGSSLARALAIELDGSERFSVQADDELVLSPEERAMLEFGPPGVGSAQDGGTGGVTALEHYLNGLWANSIYEGEVFLAQGNVRARPGHNSGDPLMDPRTGQVLGIPIPRGPLGPIWAPIEGFFDFTGPANRATAALLDAERESLRTELRRLDPNWREGFAWTARGPESNTSRITNVIGLREERAFMRYRLRGDLAPLQVETLRVYQGFVDQGFAEAMGRHRAGTLRIPRGWNVRQAVGSYTDAYARVRMRQWYGHNGVSEGAGRDVAVNRRHYTQPEGSFRIPDVRVGGVVFDATLAPKNSATPQIRGYLGAPSTSMVVVVRPRAIGPSYYIPR